MDIGVGGGFFVMPIEFTIGGSGLSTKSESITAPLPVLNVRADFALTRRLFFKTNAQFFYIKIDDFKASIVAGSVAFEYDVWKNVGFGIGYNHFRTFIEAEDDSYPGASFVGNIEFAYSGLNLYLKVYFF
jgi:hypothetical protein